MRNRMVSLVALSLQMVAATALALPCAGFTDVEAGSAFCTAVSWMKNRSVTTGCTAAMYCPDLTVSRAHMALFLSRLERMLPPAVTSTASGAVLGSLAMSADSDHRVLVRRGEDLYALALQYDYDARDLTLRDAQTWYSTADCTGQPYADTLLSPPEGGTRVAHVTRGPHGALLLFATGTYPLAPTSVTHGSILAWGACIATTGTRLLVPATFIEDLSVKYGDPYELR